MEESIKKRAFEGGPESASGKARPTDDTTKDGSAAAACRGAGGAAKGFPADFDPIPWPALTLNEVADKTVPAAMNWKAPDPNPIVPVATSSCETFQFLHDSNIPEHHREVLDEDADEAVDVGKYHFFDLDFTDGDGNVHSLRLAMNDGSGDCNDGVWGGLWDLNTNARLADLESTGDCETTVTQREEWTGNLGFSPPAFRSSSLILATKSDFERFVVLLMNWASQLTGAFCPTRDDEEEE
mmetsp:Transcript_1427/g.3210  ORF Transcript_1427/g.3210 Transcript_1427/m.3210 type:complete len:240 (-) Transcript_1427:115-834(-)